MSDVNPGAGLGGRGSEPLPTVRAQWASIGLGLRCAVVGVPLALVALIAVLSPTLGLVAAVLVVGMGLATVVYAKNRTDRLNAIHRDGSGPA